MATISLPYCVPCGNMYICKENGVIVDLGHTQVKADLFECEECGHQIVQEYAKAWLPSDMFERMKD